jgi:hypothetical protein
MSAWLDRIPPKLSIESKEKHPLTMLSQPPQGGARAVLLPDMRAPRLSPTHPQWSM